MSGEIAEHDYATYIIEQALESGDNHVVIAMEEFVNPEDFLRFKSVQEDHLSEAMEESATAEEPVSETVPSYRSEASRGSTSGYWSEADVHRLLRIYIKHLKAYPNLKWRPFNCLWEKIAKDFDRKNRFTQHQIKTKILRLKNSGKAFLETGEEQGKRWPFLKPVVEILKLEGGLGTGKSSTKIKGTPSWQPQDIDKLLSHYKQILEESPGLSRRHIFTSIAKQLGRPKFDVQLKFQSLKSSWRRYSDGIMQSKWPYFDRMQEIIDQEVHKPKPEENTADNSSNKEESVVVQNPRWSREETHRLLNAYTEKLNALKANRTVLTKVQIYRLISEAIGFSVQSIQTKLSSLRTHWNKHGKFPDFKWHFHNAMSEIVKLENSIWLQEEDENDEEDEDADPKNDKPIQKEREYPEPPWVKHYRQETQRRHEESMQMRLRIINALERLMPQETLEDTRDEFDILFAD